VDPGIPPNVPDANMVPSRQRSVEERFAGMRCRSVSVQFKQDGTVAMFELVLQNDEIKVAEERHYKLVPAKDLEPTAVRSYR
jgi:hypothetical protein